MHLNRIRGLDRSYNVCVCVYGLSVRCNVMLDYWADSALKMPCLDEGIFVKGIWDTNNGGGLCLLLGLVATRTTSML